MVSVTIVSLKILTGTFCNCLSNEKILIIARSEELSNSQNALIVKLWKDGDSYRNISGNLNIPFTTISSFLARFKRCNTVEKKKKNRCSKEDFSKIIEKIKTPRLTKIKRLRVKSYRKICVY